MRAVVVNRAEAAVVWFSALLFSGLMASGALAQTNGAFTRVQTQFIAALGEPGQSAGSNAEAWGLWEKDPGPRGVWLSLFPVLARAGMAPAGWAFDSSDWWLEEHGLIMEQPVFGLAPGRYLVTGGREATVALTIGPVAADGSQPWELADGATLADVTHLGCRAGRYKPVATGVACSPGNAPQTNFPITPGQAMPQVDACVKQDYAVLFVVGIAEGS